MKYYIYLTVLVYSILHISCKQQKDTAQIQSDKKPNIIFLLTDDQRDNTFSAMGHPFIKTPNADKLIKNGIRFSNTYIAEPVCSPSRVALFTGTHERINGVGFSSSYQLTEEQWSQSYPELLRQSGYYTGFVGKFGVEYYTFRGKASEKFDYWWGHDGWTKFFPKKLDKPTTRPYHKAKADIITPIMGEAIGDFFDKKADNQPFCLSVSFNTPHGSQAISMHSPKGEPRMASPANERPELKDHPIYGNLYRDFDMPIPAETGTDPYKWIPKSIMDHSKGRTKTYSYNYSVKTAKEHAVRYHQMITGIDKVIGDMMDNLEKRGLADNTIIIFASDHGLLMGEYGIGGKSLLYDLASKIPCFVYDPRLPQKQRGKDIKKLVSSLDLTSTILDYAGIQPPSNMQGKSLVPLINGQTKDWRDELFLESLFTMRDNPFCEGIRTEEWKYIRMFDGVNQYNEEHIDFAGKKPDFEQLFNLKDDPEEKINLIEKYEGSKLLKELREKCKAQSIEMNNKREKYKQEVITVKKEPKKKKNND